MINYLAAYVILKMYAFYKGFEYYRLVSVAEPDLVNGTIKSLLCKLKVLQLRYTEWEYNSHLFHIILSVSVSYHFRLITNNCSWFYPKFIFLSNLSCLINKDIYFASSIFLEYHFWKCYRQLNNFFIIFVTNKVFITLFTKRNSVRYQYYIKLSIAET